MLLRRRLSEGESRVRRLVTAGIVLAAALAPPLQFIANTMDDSAAFILAD